MSDKWDKPLSFTKTVSESDVYLYAGVTGNLNPAHINEIYASGTAFKNPYCRWDASGGDFFQMYW